MYSLKEAVETAISMSLKVIRMYKWLLDLYVLDFFVEEHWEKLPASWRDSFENMDPQILGDILSGVATNHVLPLSFLALINTVKALSLQREGSERTFSTTEQSSNKIVVESMYDTCESHPRLKNLFLKHVKLKKRHEISLMAEVVRDTAVKSNCEAVLDFGSGLGHLVRVLAYKNNLYAAGIECQTQLTEEARKLDLELEYTAKKHLSAQAVCHLRRPIHFNVTLTSPDQLHRLSLPDCMTNYGLVGLHPCGDLGPLLLRHFVTCEKVTFICIVGCCFMKLTCDGECCGYPMSDYVKSLDNALSYASREIACHAIEVYCNRLREGNYKDLKIHAYRAALERILVEHDPKLKHAPVRSIKHSSSMTFQRYCSLALERLTVLPALSPLACSRGDDDLRLWRRVVTVYSLRLALAPLVETVLLLDRVLFVLEHGLSCEIRPVFDPKISPRNHIIVARRSGPFTKV